MGDLKRRLVTVQEMAEILQVPKSWIYHRTRQGQGEIPHVKLGLYVRFDPDEVIKFFKSKANGVIMSANNTETTTQDESAYYSGSVEQVPTLNGISSASLDSQNYQGQTSRYKHKKRHLAY